MGDDPVAYDVWQEPRGDHPYLSSDFQVLVDRGKSLAKNVHGALNSWIIPNSSQQDIHRLLDDTLRLSSFTPADTRTVAILGDAGEGM